MFGSLKKKSYSNNSKNQNKSFLYSLFESIIIIVPIAFFIRTFFYGLYQVPTGSMEHTMLVGERFFADKFTILFSDLKRGDIITFNSPKFNYSDNKIINLWQRYVWGPENWTKRLIALPGDEIKGVIENDKPVVYLKKKGEADFVKLDEVYLNNYPIIAIYQTDLARQLVYKTYDPNFSPENQPFYRMKPSEIKFGEKITSICHQPSIIYPGTVRNTDVFHKQLGEQECWAMGDNRLNSDDSRVWGALDKKLIHGKIVYRLWSLDSEEYWWIWDLIKHPIDFWKRIRWNRCFQRVK